jgi:hypothetical protein
MLQIAGLAAILNEINPRLGKKLHDIFDITSGSVREKITEPLVKSYKHGFTAGVLTGILLSGTAVVIIWRWRRNNDNKIDISAGLKASKIRKWQSISNRTIHLIIVVRTRLVASS